MIASLSWSTVRARTHGPSGLVAVAMLACLLAAGLIRVSGADAAEQTTRGPASELLGTFPRGSLEIATTDGKLHRLQIWVAADDRRRMQGLMHVTEMPDDAGMLFVFATPRIISMWMKNTVMSLDMVFIAADGRVLRVAAGTPPFSLDTIGSEADALGVLELKAGTAARLNITSGAAILHPAFRR